MNKTIIGLSVGLAGTGMLFAPVVPKPMNINDYKAVVQMYNYEVKRAGGATLKDVNNDNFINKLNTFIRSRDTASTTINGTELSPQEYQSVREALLEKTEQKNINLAQIIYEKLFNSSVLSSQSKSQSPTKGTE